MAPRLGQGTCWAIEDPSEKNGWDLWDSWDLCVLSVIRRRRMERLLRRLALSPTRRFAKEAPAGFSTERAPLSYHATLLRLTVAFLNGNIMTAGLAIPQLH